MTLIVVRGFRTSPLFFRVFVCLGAVLFAVVLAVVINCVGLRYGDRFSMQLEKQAVNYTMNAYTATVIFLHGLGDTGDGVSSIFDDIRQTHIKYVFPTARTMPVTVNYGMVMPSWFDVHGLSQSSPEDEASTEAAAQLLQSFIAEEEKLGVRRDRIVVGGLSQGGATVLYSLFSIPQSPVAGIIGLSTWLPLHKKFPEVIRANRQTPVLLCHGEADNVVSLDFGKLTSEKIQEFNSNLQFRTYPNLMHWVDEKEMKDVEKFINTCLPPI